MFIPSSLSPDRLFETLTALVKEHNGSLVQGARVDVEPPKRRLAVRCSAVDAMLECVSGGIVVNLEWSWFVPIASRVEASEKIITWLQAATCEK